MLNPKFTLKVIYNQALLVPKTHSLGGLQTNIRIHMKFPVIWMQSCCNLKLQGVSFLSQKYFYIFKFPTNHIQMSVQENVNTNSYDVTYPLQASGSQPWRTAHWDHLQSFLKVPRPKSHPRTVKSESPGKRHKHQHFYKLPK